MIFISDFFDISTLHFESNKQTNFHATSPKHRDIFVCSPDIHIQTSLSTKSEEKNINIDKTQKTKKEAKKKEHN